MRTLLRLVLLFVLALVVFMPAVDVAFAADGSGQEVASTASGWLTAVLYIGGIVLAIAGLIFALAVGRKYYERLATLLPKVDANPLVVGFGQSIPGRAVNDALGRLLSKVDSADDPFLVQAQQLPVFKYLFDMGIIDGKTLADLASRALTDGIKLTNGVPDVEFSLLNYDSTQSKG